MGAFFLYHSTSKINIDETKSYFSLKSFGPPKLFSLTDYKLLYYPKILTKENNYYKDEISGNIIIGTGTFIYKKKFNREALISILSDYKNNLLSSDRLYGIYCFIILINDKLFIINEPNGLFNVYYNEDSKSISSSFLALVYSFPHKLTLNRNAITEILLTGGNILPDTPFNEIKKLDPAADKKLNDIILYSVRNDPDNSFDQTKNTNRSQLVKAEVQRLENYFNEISYFLNRYGGMIGLSGGFDSRLLMALTEKEQYKVSYFTFWNQVENDDQRIAKELTEKVKKSLELIELSDPLRLSDEEIINQMEEGFLYTDGHIRSQLYYHEPQNSGSFIEKTYKDYSVGIQGIGGEQYRNVDRNIRPSYSFSDWLRYDVTYRYSTPSFNSKQSEDSFLDYISGKIRFRLKLTGNRIDKYNAKRYFNEVYLESVRGYRASLENQYHYYLAPFAEYVHTKAAAYIINALGPAFDFESNMIRLLDHNLASVRSNYGYSFINCDPLKTKLQAYIKEILPKALFYTIYSRIKKNNNSNYYDKFVVKFPFFKEYENHIIKIGLPLNIDLLKNNKYSGLLLISLGYFLNRLKDKIEF